MLWPCLPRRRNPRAHAGDCPRAHVVLPRCGDLRPGGRTLGPRLSARRRSSDARQVVLRRPFQERPVHAGHHDVRGLSCRPWPSTWPALGYTLDRDGWRFEPVQDESYKLVCRGQVIPSNKHVVYEVFVEEVIHGPTPTLYADLLVTVDGLAAFHCRRMGLRLVPAFPLESRQSLFAGGELLDPAPARNARTPDHVYDPRSIAACAWGKPSDAFGELFARFDGPERCPRLPGPPYLFMTRITAIDAPKGVPVSGGTLEAEYQIPPDAWYFSENGNRTMPYAVLLEAALQPCGWFASYKGSVLHSAGGTLLPQPGRHGDAAPRGLPGGRCAAHRGPQHQPQPARHDDDYRLCGRVLCRRRPCLRHDHDLWLLPQGGAGEPGRAARHRCAPGAPGGSQRLPARAAPAAAALLQQPAGAARAHAAPARPHHRLLACGRRAGSWPRARRDRRQSAGLVLQVPLHGRLRAARFVGDRGDDPGAAVLYARSVAG